MAHLCAGVLMTSLAQHEVERDHGLCRSDPVGSGLGSGRARRSQASASVSRMSWPELRTIVAVTMVPAASTENRIITVPVMPRRSASGG